MTWVLSFVINKLSDSASCLAYLHFSFLICKMGTILLLPILLGYRASLVAQRARNCPHAGDHRFDPWVGKILWRRAWQPIPALLPGESNGQRSLEGYSL